LPGICRRRAGDAAAWLAGRGLAGGGGLAGTGGLCADADLPVGLRPALRVGARWGDRGYIVECAALVLGPPDAERAAPFGSPRPSLAALPGAQAGCVGAGAHPALCAADDGRDRAGAFGVEAG